MKEFSLEEYLKNPERKVETRDGRKARIACTDRAGLNAKPIVALITLPNGDEVIKTFWDNGIEIAGSEDRDNLFFAPTKHEGWINLPALTPEEQGDLPHPFKIPVFETEAKARMARENVERCRIKIEDNARYYSVKIEWEE